MKDLPENRSTYAYIEQSRKVVSILKSFSQERLSKSISKKELSDVFGIPYQRYLKILKGTTINKKEEKKIVETLLKNPYCSYLNNSESTYLGSVKNEHKSKRVKEEKDNFSRFIRDYLNNSLNPSIAFEILAFVSECNSVHINKISSKGRIYKLVLNDLIEKNVLSSNQEAVLFKLEGFKIDINICDVDTIHDVIKNNMPFLSNNTDFLRAGFGMISNDDYNKIHKELNSIKRTIDKAFDRSENTGLKEKMIFFSTQFQNVE